MITQERCPDCKGVQKSIEILEKSDIEIKQNINALTISLNDVSNRFSELTGMLKPTLKNLDKLVKDQEELHKIIQITRGETGTVTTDLATYKIEHGKTHKSLKWAVQIMGGASIVGILTFISKLVGLL